MATLSANPPWHLKSVGTCLRVGEDARQRSYATTSDGRPCATRAAVAAGSDRNRIIVAFSNATQ
eukprot:1698614-Lingulodinium_polyedra.AAC.1